jgi:hypothetical protein
LKKLIANIVLATFIVFVFTLVSTSFADEGTNTTTKTTAITSDEAERAANTAVFSGINDTVIEGAIFVTGIVVMGIAISLSSDSTTDQAHGHGH